MPQPIRSAEVKWKDVIRLEFGFTGLNNMQAIPIIRSLISDQWIKSKRHTQSAYVIRLRGEVAVNYRGRFSPVIYIGEGNAYARLYSHAKWISSLLVAVPRAEVEIHVADVARRNNPGLYKNVEADMIKWFRDEYKCLPWFNRQSETSREGRFSYTDDAMQELRRKLLVGSGSRFLWSIAPTHNNEQFEPYGLGCGAL